jgi:hypothetical protein
VKIGVQIYYYDWPGGTASIGPKLTEIARTEEESGFHSLWVMDVLSTIRLAPDGTSPAEVLSLCERLQRFGIDHVIFNMPNVHEIRPLEILGEEVIVAVAAM